MNNLERIISSETYNELMDLDIFPRCFNLVYLLFENKCDKEGKPYINHLINVSYSMGYDYDLDGMIVGLLHDVVEDIDGVTFNDLLEFGVKEELIEVLKLVTNDNHDKNLSEHDKLRIYNEKIDSIINSENNLAIGLKYYDMKDNFNDERLKHLSKELQSWFKLKYETNLKKLEVAKNKCEEKRKVYDRY